jgi:F-type H+-transporting ATPase subunit b
MIKVYALLLPLILIVNNAQAAGGGHGSIVDLKWPALNFVLLFSFLIWKIKPAMREMFDKNATDVASLFELAEKKDKEAQIQLTSYQKKLSDLVSEKNKIMKEADKEAAFYEEETKKETAQYIERMSKDANAKLASEKSSLIKNVYSELVDEIITKTKNKIGTDINLKTRATNNLISKI